MTDLFADARLLAEDHAESFWLSDMQTWTLGELAAALTAAGIGLGDVELWSNDPIVVGWKQ